jgi:cbb3-type cytochrome oxidase maturation protein
VLILTIILLVMTTLLGFIFFAMFHWAVKDGQFEDPEEAKYVIFREDEPHRSGAVDGGDDQWGKKTKKA